MSDKSKEPFPIVATNYPKTVKFVITNRCNQKCKFCAGSFSGAKDDTELTKKKLWNKLRNVNSDADPDSILRMSWLKHVKTIILQGNGEALAHPKYYDFVKNIRTMAPHATLKYWGNGLGFNGKKLDITLRSMDFIHVSLNAVRKKTFDNIIEMGSHKHTMLGLKKISEYKRRNPNKFKVQISAVIIKETLEEFPRLIDFAAKMGFEHVRGMVGEYPGHNNIPADSYFEDINDHLDVDMLTQYARERGVVFSTNDSYRRDFKVRVCADPWNNLFFTAGEQGWYLSVCCRGKPGLILPYDKGEDLFDFYNHDTLKFIRRTVNDADKILANKMCLRCRMSTENLKKFATNEDFYSRFLTYQLCEDEIVL